MCLENNKNVMNLNLNLCLSCPPVSSSKRKKLQQGSAISGSVKNLEIHCKDFRIHTFSFKFCSKEEAKMVGYKQTLCF